MRARLTHKDRKLRPGRHRRTTHLGMQVRRLFPQLQHVTKHRDAPTTALGKLPERTQRGQYRIGVRVVRVVVERNAANLLARHPHLGGGDCYQRAGNLLRRNLQHARAGDGTERVHGVVIARQADRALPLHAARLAHTDRLPTAARHPRHHPPHALLAGSKRHHPHARLDALLNGCHQGWLITVHNGDAHAAKAVNDGCLLADDRLHRAHAAQVRAARHGDDRHMRCGHPCQRRDLAGVIHANFNY